MLGVIASQPPFVLSSLAMAVLKWPPVRQGPAQSVREHLTPSLKSMEQPCCQLRRYHWSNQKHPKFGCVS